MAVIPLSGTYTGIQDWNSDVDIIQIAGTVTLDSGGDFTFSGTANPVTFGDGFWVWCKDGKLTANGTNVNRKSWTSSTADAPSGTFDYIYFGHMLTESSFTFNTMTSGSGFRVHTSWDVDGNLVFENNIADTCLHGVYHDSTTSSTLGSVTLQNMGDVGNGIRFNPSNASTLTIGTTYMKDCAFGDSAVEFGGTQGNISLTNLIVNNVSCVGHFFAGSNANDHCTIGTMWGYGITPGFGSALVGPTLQVVCSAGYVDVNGVVFAPGVNANSAFSTMDAHSLTQFFSYYGGTVTTVHNTGGGNDGASYPAPRIETASGSPVSSGIYSATNVVTPALLPNNPFTLSTTASSSVTTTTVVQTYTPNHLCESQIYYSETSRGDDELDLYEHHSSFTHSQVLDDDGSGEVQGDLSARAQILTGLTPGKTYYPRAVGTLPDGSRIYGDEGSPFTTTASGDTTAPPFPVEGSGITAVNAASSGDITVSCNAAGAASEGFAFRQKITIDADAYIASDLADFTLTVHIDNTNANFWANDDGNGTYVRFTKSDGATPLNFELESYDAIGEDAWWHVMVPELSSSVDTDIYMYYDHTSPTDGSMKEGAWDSNYQAVYHFNQDKAEGAFDDSTINDNDGTNSGSTDAAGLIDRARNFDGANDKITVDNAASLQAIRAIEFTFKPNVLIEAGFDTVDMTVINKHTSHDHAKAHFDYVTGEFHYFPEDLAKQIESDVNSWATGTFHSIVIAADDSDIMRMYVNSVLQTQTVDLEGADFMDSQGSIIMGGQGNSEWFDGTLEELTYSDGVRTADWVAARYRSGLGAWLSFSAQEAVSPAADESLPVRYRYAIKAGDIIPFPTPDRVVILETNAPTKINIGADDILYSVGVQAFDSVNNITDNTDYVTVTPTGDNGSPLDPPTLNSLTNEGSGTIVTLNITPPADPVAIYVNCQVQYKLAEETTWTNGVTYVGIPSTPGDVDQTGLINNNIYDFQVVAFDSTDKYTKALKADSIFTDDGTLISEDEAMLDNLETLLATCPSFQDLVGATGDAAAKLATAKAHIFQAGSDSEDTTLPFVIIDTDSPASHDIIATTTYGVIGTLSAEFFIEASSPTLNYEAIRRELTRVTGTIHEELKSLAYTDNFLRVSAIAPLSNFERYETKHDLDLQTVKFNYTIPAF